MTTSDLAQQGLAARESLAPGPVTSISPVQDLKTVQVLYWTCAAQVQTPGVRDRSTS